jgi:hypothetical protein
MPFAATPNNLVAALQQCCPSALAELERQCRGPIQDVVKEINGRLGLRQNVSQLTEYTLRWVTMHLRVQDPAKFAFLAATDDLSWEVFRNYVRWKAGQMLWGPIPVGAWVRRCPRWLRFISAAVGRRLLRKKRLRGEMAAGLSSSDVFGVSAFSRPLDLVGGDWYTAACRGDTLWVLLADVCGKSWPAYILAQGLPFLWDSCLVVQPDDAIEMLARLDGHLQACLPDGLFLEATVARFAAQPQGQVQVAAAGRSLVLGREAGQAAMWREDLGGPFLGLGLAGPRDQTAWPLAVGDEVLLASDGLLDQPAGSQRLGAVLKPPALPCHCACTLHEAVLGLLQQTWRDYPQRDDVTVLTVQRR